MAQLIKLLDYPSRYEGDLFHYPSQFVVLKRQQWKKINNAWLTGNWESLNEEETSEVLVEDIQPKQISDVEIKSKKQQFFQFLNKVKFSRKKSTEEAEEVENVTPSDEISSILEVFRVANEYFTEKELKQKFLDEFFKFQLKWATSRMIEESEIDRKIIFDDNLRYFLQSFPDNFLVLYQPVLYVGKAPIELEVIIVGPVETLCISIINGEENHVNIYNKGNFWTQKMLQREKKIVNPINGLNRMVKLVNQIYRKNDIVSNVRKILLCKSGYIDYLQAPHELELIDKRNYQDWHEQIINTSSPIKLNQLKAAQSILSLCEYTNHIELVNKEAGEED
ncbi:NERD domain-containing protein [Bacillus sp. RG28]|uniref:NERD domain-containing protein n=1 Tax=Gottfriedia endophytica TaxID=2820819 RepID=A0A940SJT5_9BACI|nr:NERD domain-containing protein [Gottfriedia endophytica]MBP0726365.1 NERD domain-containing protein [Gottfriedia endophytica]